MIKARLFRFAVGAAFVLFALMSIAAILPDGMADGAD